MATQKRGSAFFEAEKFTQRLGELVVLLLRTRDPGQPVEDRVLRGGERGGEPVGAPARGARLSDRREHGHGDRL